MRRKSGQDYGRFRDLAAAIFAVFAAAGVVAQVVDAPSWIVFALPSTGVIGALVSLVLLWQAQRAERRAEREALLRRPPLRVREVTRLVYALGVDTEAPQVRALLRGQPEHAPYLRRTIDDDLRKRLQEAAAVGSVSLIVVSGPSKAGKSRTLLEAVGAVLGDAWLLAPADANALVKLARAPLTEVGAEPAVIWLDDIEPFVKSADDGLSPETLEELEQWRGPVLVLATHGGKGVDLAGSDAKRFAEPTRDLLRRAELFSLSAVLSRDETEGLRELFGDEAADRIETEGIGEFMVAAPELLNRLKLNRDCPEGQAIVHVAIDCHRAGLLRPLPEAWLQDLYHHHFPGAPSTEHFGRGLDWATRPLYSNVALLAHDEASGDFYAHDYLVYVASSEGWPIKGPILDRVIDEYAQTEDELLRVGEVAYFVASSEPGDQRTQRAWRRAEKLGSAFATFNLGVLSDERGDFDAAEDAYKRAAEGGVVAANVNLGILLKERGDLDAAEVLFKRGEKGGIGESSVHLGNLLEERGQIDKAERAFRRAMDLGITKGAFNLGVLLRRRNDLEPAEAAFRLADEKGDVDAADRLGLVLKDQGRIDAAEEVWRRADAQGDPNAAYNLGVLLLTERKNLDEALKAFQRADERGHAEGAVALARLLGDDPDEAE